MDDIDRHWFGVGVGAPLVFGIVAVARAVPLMRSRERRAAIELAGPGAVATVVGAIYGFVQVF